MVRTEMPLLVWVAMSFGLVAGGCGSQSRVGLIERGDRALLEGQYDDAAAQYAAAQKRDRTPAVSLRLATALLKEDRPAEALAELDRSGDMSSKAHYLRAVCGMALNDVPEAKKWAEQALQGNANDAMALSLVARIHFLQQHYAQSARVYQDALSFSSDEQIRSVLLRNLAVAQFQAGHFSQADETFNRYLGSQDFVTEEDKRLAGSVAYAAGDRDRAFKHWQTLPAKQRQAILDALASDTEIAKVLVN